MSGDHVTTEDDLAKAREIAWLSGPFVGSTRMLEENVAKAIAKGIAFGRKQAIELARQGKRANLSKNQR